MNTAVRALLAVGVWLAATSSAGAAEALAYPNRPVRLIVPFGVGGSTDVLARIIAPRLSMLLGQSVIVDNRGGGAGLPAYELVAKASPDGYTLLFAGSNMASNPVLFKKLPYDTNKAFAPVSLVAIIPTVLVVNRSLGVDSVKELINLAKAKPGALNYGSVGNGSGPHVTAEVFNHAANIRVEHVPYKGAAAALTDLAAGRLTYMFATTTSAYPFVASGRLKALGISSRERSSAMPDVPTLAEAALPGFDVNIWLGIVAPAATSPVIIAELNAALRRVLQDGKVQEQFKTLGAMSMAGSPAEFTTHLKRELQRWVNLAKTVNFEIAN